MNITGKKQFTSINKLWAWLRSGALWGVLIGLIWVGNIVLLLLHPESDADLFKNNGIQIFMGIGFVIGLVGVILGFTDADAIGLNIECAKTSFGLIVRIVANSIFRFVLGFLAVMTIPSVFVWIMIICVYGFGMKG